MKKQILFFLSPFLLMFASCATVLNPTKVKIKVLTTKDAHLVINGDTLKPADTPYYKITVPRRKEALQIMVFNETTHKSVQIPANNSFAYWLNSYPGPHLWTGFIIDKNNPRRYAYPKKIRIDLNDERVYIPHNIEHVDRSIIFKLAPHRLNGFFMPGLEAGVELKHNEVLSTSLTATYLLNSMLFIRETSSQPGFCGYRVALEERLYLSQSAPVGMYMAFELDYLNKKEKKEGTFMNDDSLHGVYKDMYKINRQCYIVNLKLGRQWIFNRFSVDLFAGLGVRYRNVETIYTAPSSELTRSRKSPNFDSPGKFFIINIPINFRIGFAF